MIPVLDSARMRAADAAAIRSGTPSWTLMENAATALVHEALAAFPDWRRVVVVCGPGNNGGDGLAAARLLDAHGLSVSVFSLNDPSEYRGDPAENLARLSRADIAVTSLAARGGMARFALALSEAEGVIDALFGTGLSRALTGRTARAVDAINEAADARALGMVAADARALQVVAADLPSGLSSDSGAVAGPSVLASLTVAFGAPKLCHVFPPARARCGRVAVADIGIPREVLSRSRRPIRIQVRVVEASDAAALLPPRARDSHKGDFGRLAVVAGSRGKAGAAILAARGALRAGAGLVTIFCPASIELAAVGALPEAMTVGLPDSNGALDASAAGPLEEALSGFDAVVAGPGLTTSEGVREVLRMVLRLPLPLLIDADALNVFAGEPGALARRGSRQTVLTPHPGEAGRLLSVTTAAVQADRLGAATRLARACRAVVVLKGEGTLTAAGKGGRSSLIRVSVNPTGTPLLSTAGSGDVLAGVIGAFLASGKPAEEAAMAGAYLHGLAAERLELSLGDAGLLASELADELPRARKRLSESPGSASGGRARALKR